ncbi:MAG: hypothetical protein P8X48_10420 [Acidiferrobacteraceae bacterium]|jgi:hypothetical protein
MSCSHIPTCAMFPLISVNSALKVWKAFYCEGKNTECARYQMSLQGKSVPANLLPNGKTLELDKLVAGTGAKPAAAAAPVAVPSSAPAAAAAAVPTPAPAPARPKLEAVPKPAAAPAPAASVSGATMSYYLRIATPKTSGVMSDVIRILGTHHVRIDAVSEKRAVDGGNNNIIVLTDQVDKGDLQGAITEIESHPDVAGTVTRLPLEAL